jgi:hypothetical protein
VRVRTALENNDNPVSSEKLHRDLLYSKINKIVRDDKLILIAVTAVDGRKGDHSQTVREISNAEAHKRSPPLY